VERGDIYGVNLDPTAGHEQRGRRPVLVISRASFNRLGVALVCPISQGGEFARSAGWTVALAAAGTRTQGVVLCHQSRTVDLKARKAKRIETAPGEIVDEVLAKLQTILD
jgi:mRNA interferase ChpB